MRDERIFASSVNPYGLIAFELYTVPPLFEPVGMRNRGEGVVETLPFVEIDFTLNIAPPKNGEIEFSMIRDLIYCLVAQGVKIRWVSLDSYQSAGTIQQLRRKGIKSGFFSVDKDPKAYLLLKEILSDRRIVAPSHERLIYDYARECLALKVARKLNSQDVLEQFGYSFIYRGLPGFIRSDNGPEFIGKALDRWAYESRVTLDFSRSGKHTDSAFIESLNGSFRDECLNLHWFLSLKDAKEKI